MYKTILVHVDQSVHAPARMHFACGLAHAHGSHVLGAAMFGVSRTVFPRGYDAEPGTLSASYFQPLADNARSALSAFEAAAAKAQVKHEARFVCDQADDGLARLARFADLAVISQDDPAESMPDMAVHLPEYLILNCARPVLVIPRADPAPWRGQYVLVAWDGSKEASAALGAAIPMLHRASGVTVVSLTGEDGGEDEFRAQQADLRHFLERHQVNARMQIRAPRQPHRETGRELLALAKELGCDMLVMGCFGHSRFRELCLGGASRTVLAEADIPVLLAH